MSVSRSFTCLLCCLGFLLTEGAPAWSQTIGSGLNAKRASRPGVRRAETAEYEEEQPLFTSNAKSKAKRMATSGTLAGHKLGTLHKPQVRGASHEYAEETYDDDGGQFGSEGCSSGACGDGACADGQCGDMPAEGWVGGSCLMYLAERGEYFTGAQSFSGPANRGGPGSFGFQHGFNIGSPGPLGVAGIGMQAGMSATISNLNGADFTRDDRLQIFATLGIFRRVDWGFQWGLAVDLLHDDWYYQTNLHQLQRSTRNAIWHPRRPRKQCPLMLPNECWPKLSCCWLLRCYRCHLRCR